MKKETRIVSEDGSTVQVTRPDERWYTKETKDENGNVTKVISFPSVTWIVDHYPKGHWYVEWVAKNGLTQAEAIRDARGDHGHKVHQAITKLLRGETISIDSSVENQDTGQLEPISLEQYEAVMTFMRWFRTVNPTVLANELVVFNYEYEYAGTVDFICEINGVKWLIDFKTSKFISPSYELQLAAYAHSLPPELQVDKAAILQLGYAKNKNGYKFTEIKDEFDVFLATKKIWAKQTAGAKVLQKELPMELSLPVINRPEEEINPLI